VRPVFVAAALVAAGGVAFVLFEPTGTLTFLPQIAAYGLALLMGCMICHGELVRLRPAPQHLTAYYLTLAAGGAVGGLFVGVVAPYVFDRLWELYIGYWGTTAALVVAMLRDPRSCLNGPRGWPWRFVAWAAVTAIAVASLLVVPHFDPQSVRRIRNFYGILRVEEENADDPEEHALVLYHGRIMHGSQFQDPALRRTPGTYYAEDSGVALAILNHPARAVGPDGRGHMRIGVVGLGAGTLAAYGRAGDTIRFYEINPAMVGLSQGRGASFTYLDDSPARIEIALGDARLSLEREPPQQFDVLAIDAFSGDAVPVHLLTVEAFQAYLRHLAPGGVLAVHTSNTFLDLDRVVQAQADHRGLRVVAMDSPIDTEERYWATWMLLVRDGHALDAPAIRAAPHNDRVKSVRLWTDDYSNLLEVLR
jgi:spermidine synthase